MQTHLILSAIFISAIGALTITNSKPLTPSTNFTPLHKTHQLVEVAKSKIGSAEPNSWTILVYLHADHNLEESSETDLEEMEKIGSGKEFNLIVQWDRLSEDGVQRIKIGKGNENSEVIEELPELDSDDPKTLADFIRWGVKTYPASRYGLIIWDHGAQWQGIGGDETTGEDSIMDLNEIQQALQNSLKAVGLSQFDFLAFDTCLMGGLEPLVQLAQYSKIYIANPEIDYGDGWDYTADFGFLKDKPYVSMVEFAKQQNLNWKAHHSVETSDINNRAHVIYDSSKVSAIAAATKTFSYSLLQTWDKNELQLATIRGRTVEYNFDNEDPHAPHDYIDLGDFVAKLANKDPSLKISSDNLNTAIQKSVIAKTLGKNNATAQGLSVWLPSDRNSPPEKESIQAYMELPVHNSSNWKNFVERWFGTVQENTAAPQITIFGQKNLQNPTVHNGALVAFHVRDQDLNTIYASIGKENENGFVYYSDLFFKTADPGKYHASWEGNLLTISDGAESSLFPGFYQNANDHLLYANAVATSSKSKQIFDVTLVLDNKKNRVVTVLDESGASPKSINLEPGTTLELQFLQYNFKTNKTTLVSTGTTLTVPANGLAGFKISQTRLAKGNYTFTVGAIDWAGNDSFADNIVTIQ